MDEFVKILLSLSVSGTLLLLLILGLKPFYKNKFSRRWQYYIWIIAVLRFLLPFAPNTVNIGSLSQKYNTTVIMDETPEIPNMPVMVNGNDNERKQAPKKAQEDENVIDDTVMNNPFNRYACFILVWAAGVLALFVRKIRIYQGFIRCIGVGSTEVSDIKTLNLLSDCKEKLRIRTRLGLYHNTLIVSPMTIGFFHPSILLPDGELEEKELAYIFMHELRHYKQRDLFYKWLIQIVICIHWFNPFVYLLEKEVNKACELSCDESVISVLDDNERRAYGDTLISFLKPQTLYKGSLASVTLTEGAKQLKERLGAIMHFKKKTKTIQLLTGAVTLCIIFGAAFFSFYPVAAADSHTAKISSTGTGEASIPKKNDRIGADVSDENQNSGWYLEDFDYKDWDFEWDDEDWDFEWDDEDWDYDWDWDDQELIEAYAAFGIEYDGDAYYYQGELVKIMKDQRTDGSLNFYGVNSKGTASIKVIRNAEDEITGVYYMSGEEAAELAAELLGQENPGKLVNNVK